MAPSGFQTVSPAQAQQALDRINASLPTSFNVHQTDDVLDALPGASRGKLEMLRQRAADARALWEPLSDQIRETRVETERSRSRLKMLVTPKASGGFGLREGDDDDPVVDPQVADVKRTIAKRETELARTSALEATRVAIWRNLGILVRRVEEFLREGRPHGTVLLEAPPIEITDVLRRDEKVNDALERLRHRLRELDADAHRINSAPYPSGDVKQRLREQLDTLANRGVPSVDRLIEHNGEIVWSQTTQLLELVAIGKDGSPVSFRGSAVAGLAVDRRGAPRFEQRRGVWWAGYVPLLTWPAFALNPTPSRQRRNRPGHD
jgi:hypothetical protein